MSASLPPGLPPLPKSLSGFELRAGSGGSQPQSRPPPPEPPRTSRPQATLDTQLAVLRREMFGLRQLDLSLLSQLWALNESIQDFRQMLQDQEQDQDDDCGPISPPSPGSATPPSSSEELVTADSNDDTSSLRAALNNSSGSRTSVSNHRDGNIVPQRPPVVPPPPRPRPAARTRPAPPPPPPARRGPGKTSAV
uniref:Putative product n=1 Tax=Xenopsylla cheopis TaxID=163159 RepID=A0A6M2DM89_XENCH